MSHKIKNWNRIIKKKENSIKLIYNIMKNIIINYKDKNHQKEKINMNFWKGKKNME